MEDAHVSRVIIRRLEPGRDLLDELSRVVRENDIRLGLLSGIGALKRAAVGMFEQERRQYRTTTFDEEMELCALAGNVSLKDGAPFCHVHLTLADREGRAFGGHAMPGCIIFVAEVAILALEGPPLARVPHDEAGGLAVWARENAGRE